MDPRRIPELSQAAALGAARRAASDARQSSILQAMMRAQGDSLVGWEQPVRMQGHTDRKSNICSACYRNVF